MIVRIKTVPVYGDADWRPCFAWVPTCITSELSGHPRVLLRTWVWLETIECCARDKDGTAPWVYRLVAK